MKSLIYRALCILALVCPILPVHGVSGNAGLLIGRDENLQIRFAIRFFADFSQQEGIYVTAGGH